jgi:hypothetical protein
LIATQAAAARASGNRMVEAALARMISPFSVKTIGPADAQPGRNIASDVLVEKRRKHDDQQGDDEKVPPSPGGPAYQIGRSGQESSDNDRNVDLAHSFIPR